MSLYLDVNAMYTLTTLSTGHKGNYDKVPPPKAFPVPYNDSFEGIYHRFILICYCEMDLAFLTCD